MNAIQRHIEVPSDVRKDIMRQLGITEGGLSLALKYKRDGEDSQKARQLALEQGGVVYCTAPECETIHDADGKMTQVFTNDARLIIDKTTGDARLEYGGRLVATYHNVTLQMLAIIQSTASELR